jgi:protein-S-isoprenylcysteine O-methyltransferase Ste14
MEPQSIDLQSLKKKLAVRFFLLLLFFSLFLLLPAGTFYFWQLYVYLAVLMGPLIFVVRYFLKNDPEFLVHRLTMKEKEREQKKIISLSAIAYLVGFLLPGLDRRFGWSEIPTAIVLAADVLVMTSYIFVVYVFKHNRYASRVIEVQKNQTVISTGPYSIVRHPMYSGMFIMFFSTPIALGSYWAVIPFALMPLTFFFRILNEEKVLSEQLPGYKEYCEKVRYRLIPYVW